MLAGLAVGSLIAIALFQIPAWILLVVILVVGSLIGDGSSNAQYAAQYDAEKKRHSKPALLPVDNTAPSAEAIAEVNRTGIYIKPIEERLNGYDKF